MPKEKKHLLEEVTRAVGRKVGGVREKQEALQALEGSLLFILVARYRSPSLWIAKSATKCISDWQQCANRHATLEDDRASAVPTAYLLGSYRSCRGLETPSNILESLRRNIERPPVTTGLKRYVL